jgi:UDP-arabinose 4-epimerase
MPGTILVTGGAGYIGSHVCKALARAGYLPVVYDNLFNGHREAVRWGPLEVGNLEDRSRLSACLAEHHPEGVIHLAGYIAAGESVVAPAKYYGNNLCGFLTLLDGMRHHGIARIVFSSTAAVYGAPKEVPIKETSPIRPVNPYGHSKAMCEQILQDYAVAYGMRSISLRYFNAAGADPDGELGECHEPETHLIPLVLEAAAGIRNGIDVYGDEYPTRDGTCVRDYIHVADLATAHVLALRKMETAAVVGAYNLGNGQGFTVLEVIDAAERVTGCPVPTRRHPPRAGDPPILLADATLAKAELGWIPAFGALETQLEHAWSWLRRRHPAVVASRPSIPVAGVTTD